ncbi:MAG: TlpA family protein disulfide reductase [Wenzhouxiangellaceae bacterium]
MMIRSLALLLVLATVAAVRADSGAAAVEARPFGPGDLDRIRADHAGQPFVLMAWSLDCLPCHRKLSRLRPVLEQHPHWRLVLVAVDDPERAGEVEQRIAEYGLQWLDHWRFDTTPPERLRYALDPHWYGELPRAWLYDAQHQRTAWSGTLPDERLARHFDS